jgi:predicted Zn-dependent protease with MMP-like domain
VGDAEEARARLRTLTAAEPELSDAWHALGIASEALGDEEGMRAAWRRTRELDVASDEAREEAGGGSGVEPDGRPRLDDKGVAALAEEALAELPERARQLLVNVPIIVADRPARDDVDAGLDPRMLGMFAGTPYPEAGAMGGQPGLTQILLFRRNLERIAGNEEELREEIRTTLLHETGHFFGMDEDDLEKVGLD